MDPFELPVPVVRTRAGGAFVTLNPRARMLFKIDRGDVSTQSFDELCRLPAAPVDGIELLARRSDGSALVLLVYGSGTGAESFRSWRG